MNLHIPFYSNTEDNTHCFQAGMKMVLKHFWPDKEFSWEELDKISSKAQGLWTWPMAGLIWFAKNGFEVVDIEVFDYEKFIEKGKEYLVELWGAEVAAIQAQHSDIEQERSISKDFLGMINVQKRLPNFEDIGDLIKQGFIVCASVNSKALNDKPGYSGHFVVITEIEQNNITLHDPGLPPKPNHKVDKHIFEKAWADPNESAKNIMAFKLK